MALGKKSEKKRRRFIAEYGLNMIALSILTGLFSGAVVTIYNILTGIGEEVSASLYNIVAENPAFIPLLFLGLAAGAFVIGTVVRLVPMIRGSGVPQIEGAARGMLRFRWYAVMCSMFAASLACVFMGLPAGSEGPSLEIGGCAGEAVGVALRRSRMVRRLQTAAGASAGLAAAFNAPVTGLVFAMEEALRSFSAQVFTCSAVSVAVSLAVRNLMRAAMGFPVGFTFTSFVFSPMEPMSYLYAAVAALAAALLGVAFFRFMLLARKGFSKLKFLRGTGKYLIPFFVAGAFGLITVYAMGGGHEFIQSLGSASETEFCSIFGSGIAFTLAVVVLFRFISNILAVGCGMPYGIFVPTLATGAGLGALLCCAFEAAGMDVSQADYIVIICMAAYFTTVVRAPVTGLVMIFEFTGQFENLLPAVIGVGIGFIVGELFRTESVFENCLDYIVREQRAANGAKKVRVVSDVSRNSAADGSAVRSVLWPYGGTVAEVINADGSSFSPSGKTRLCAGQKIVFECVTDSEEDLKEHISDITGSECKDEKTAQGENR